MSDIRDIPFKDIKEFLSVNNKDFINKDDAYDQALILLKDKKAIGHTTSIIEWLIAHNLFVRKVNIPNYTIYKIDNMSQNEINQLAKLLTMKKNNSENIKNILRYLHKLDEENIILLPEINDVILRKLDQLEKQEINFDQITSSKVIDLLKTHRNKALIRELIYNNLLKIVFYDYLWMYIRHHYTIESIIKIIKHNEFDEYPKSIMLGLIKINENELIKYYGFEKINNIINYLTENKGNMMLYINMDFLCNFITNLININELMLAKKVFDIANDYNFRSMNDSEILSINQYYNKYHNKINLDKYLSEINTS